MPDQLQLRGGDTASNNTFTGAQRELSVDTQTNSLILHDGVTPGGHRLASTAAPDFTGNVDIGGNLDVGGSATFSGTGRFGDVSVGHTDLSKNSVSIYPEKNAAGTTPIISGYDSNWNTPTFQVLADGSASFSGKVETIGDTAAFHVGLDKDANKVPFNIYDTSDANVPLARIMGDGSASFGAASNATDNNGVSIGGNNGSLNVYTTRYDTDCFQILNTSGSGTNIAVKMFGNGSATFAGNITAGNVSDIKYKENITDAKPQLDDVVTLGSSLKNWDWKEEAPLNDELKERRFLGLIAQEAEEVCPGITYSVDRTIQGELITPEEVIPAVYEDREVPAVIDEEGNELKPASIEQVLVTPEEVIPAVYEEVEDDYKAINHDILVMKLLGAVAELKAEIDQLKSN